MLAADTSQPTNTWAQEPTAFMGVDLQGDFLREVEECLPDATPSEKLCRVATDTADQFLIRGTHSRRVLLGYQLIAQLSNGRIDKLVFSGPSSSSALVAEMLRTDYGPPSHSRTNLVRTKSGTTFDNEVLQWRGERLSIESQRNDENLGTYNVMLTNMPVSTDDVQSADQPSGASASQI